MYEINRICCLFLLLLDVPKLPASIKKSDTNASHATSHHGDAKNADR